jgi:(E)-4-hydroxy-3-methylbut-2-enyl-diphosphate synthase
MNSRRKSIPIRLGNLTVGGDGPVTVQSMAKTDTRDSAATIRQIKELEEAGCEIIRVAVPDSQAAEALPAIKKAIRIPLVADIHFDHRLALAACAAGVDGLRLNPGNISEPEKVEAVVKAAAERSIPIRIGVNAGSLSPARSPDEGVPARMVAAALSQVRLLESLDFNLIKVSLKAFDVPTTIEAYRHIAELIPYPLHIGITEAGTPRTGIIRSAVGIGALLSVGIGDTIRVSLSAPACEEVSAGYEILKSLGLRQRGPVLVSCPQCGRSEMDIIELAARVEQELRRFTKPIRVAVMGCVVNGPGEAADADIGVACGKGRAVLFKRGQRIDTVAEGDILASLIREIEQM